MNEAYEPANLLNELGGLYDPSKHQGMFEEEEPAPVAPATPATPSRKNVRVSDEHESVSEEDEEELEDLEDEVTTPARSARRMSRTTSRRLSSEEFEVLEEETPRSSTASLKSRSRVRIDGIKGLQNITSLDEIKVKHAAHRSATLADQDKQRLLRLELARRTLPLSVEAFWYLFFSEHSNFTQILIEELEFKGTPLLADVSVSVSVSVCKCMCVRVLMTKRPIF